MGKKNLVGIVRRGLARWRGGAVVMAVSGGGDSVALLRAAADAAGPLGLRLSVAHLDHGARGEASAGDARFVAELAAGLGLPLDLGRWRPERAGHFEADARRARLDWLAGVARARDAGAVALGHTRDDQAETVLHRLLRGTGPRGLAGMPARRRLSEGVTLVRPLLGVGREALRAYLRDLGQPWREDASNADLARTRARIRLDLLPKLAGGYNPRVAEALARLAGLLARQRRAWESYVDGLASAVCATGDDGVVRVDRAPLLHHPDFLRAEVLRAAWRRAGWPERSMGAKAWRRLADLVGRGGRIDLPGGYAAIAGGGTLRLLPPDLATPSNPPPAPAPEPLPIPGEATWKGVRLRARAGAAGTTPWDGAGWTPEESLDPDRLEPFGPPEAPFLLIRAPEPGDRLDPLGLGGRTKPLNDHFRARRVPRADRPGVPLVCDRRGIVWVVGLGIVDRVRLGPGTRRVMGVGRADG
jgi:tRNA(Ile)-lysidine synthase